VFGKDQSKRVLSMTPQRLAERDGGTVKAEPGDVRPPEVLERLAKRWASWLIIHRDTLAMGIADVNDFRPLARRLSKIKH
jgi:hypothetical protein